MVEPRPEEDVPVSVPPPAPSRAGVGLATMALLIAAAALAGLVRTMIVNDKLEAKVKQLEAQQSDDDRLFPILKDKVSRLENAVTLLSVEPLDLMNPGLQHLRF